MSPRQPSLVADKAFFRGRFDRRGPRSGAPTPRNQLVRAIAGQSQALAWWAADSQYVHLTSGNVDTWTDLVGGKTLTDQGVSGNRPAWNGTDPQKPQVQFGGTHVLYGAANLLQGRSSLSMIVVGQAVSSFMGDATWVAYNPSPNANADRFGVEANIPGGTVARLAPYLGTAAGVLNQWALAGDEDLTSFHCWVVRGNYANGTSAMQAIRRDGVNESGSTSTAGNVSGTTLGSFSISVGALGNGTFASKANFCDILFCPLLTDAVADSVYALLKQLRSL